MAIQKISGEPDLKEDVAKKGMMSPLIKEGLKAAFALSGSGGKSLGRLQEYSEIKAEEEEAAKLEYANWYATTDADRKASIKDIQQIKQIREARRDAGKTVLADSGLKNIISKFNATAVEDQRINVDDPNFQLQIGEELARQSDKDPNKYAKLVRRNIYSTLNRHTNYLNLSELDYQTPKLINPYKSLVDTKAKTEAEKQTDQMLASPKPGFGERLSRSFIASERSKGQKEEYMQRLPREVRERMLNRTEAIKDPFQQVTPTDPITTDAETNSMIKKVNVMIGDKYSLRTETDPITGEFLKYTDSSGEGDIAAANSMRDLLVSVTASRAYGAGDEAAVLQDLSTLTDWAAVKSADAPRAKKQKKYNQEIESIKNDLRKMDRDGIKEYINDKKRQLEGIKPGKTKEKAVDYNEEELLKVTGNTLEELQALSSYESEGSGAGIYTVETKKGKFRLRFSYIGKRPELIGVDRIGNVGSATPEDVPSPDQIEKNKGIIGQLTPPQNFNQRKKRPLTSDLVKRNLGGS